MLGVGAIVIATTQIVPQILQIVTVTPPKPPGSAFARRPCDDGHDVRRGTPRFHPTQISHRVGAVAVAYGMYMLTSLYADSTCLFRRLADGRGAGQPFMFIPITVASYDGIAAGKTDQASALINLARNFGGSIGVRFRRWCSPSASNFINCDFPNGSAIGTRSITKR